MSENKILLLWTFPSTEKNDFNPLCFHFDPSKLEKIREQEIKGGTASEVSKKKEKQLKKSNVKPYLDYCKTKLRVSTLLKLKSDIHKGADGIFQCPMKNCSYGSEKLYAVQRHFLQVHAMEGRSAEKKWKNKKNR
eukprot:3938119-Rhodomonas_salina.2